jgi:hypothetical protein
VAEILSYGFAERNARHRLCVLGLLANLCMLGAIVFLLRAGISSSL